MVSDLGDERVANYIAKVSDFQWVIAKYLDSMLPKKANLLERHNVYNSLVSEISLLNSISQKWAHEYIPEFLLAADKEAIEDLGIIDYAHADPVLNERLQSHFKKHISKAIRSISSKAFMMLRFSDSLEVFEKDNSLLRIVGKDGKAKAYKMDYYFTMVARSVASNAHKMATLERAKKVNHQYFKVSSEKTGSFCDQYAGKVYSLKGLQALPNQGPPFHPLCSHTLRIHIK